MYSSQLYWKVPNFIVSPQQHGSPVEPQTLEAFIVHSIDTLDAHAEIMRAAWLAADPNATLIDAPRPLKGKLARSLKRTSADAAQG